MTRNDVRVRVIVVQLDLILAAVVQLRWGAVRIQIVLVGERVYAMLDVEGVAVDTSDD